MSSAAVGAVELREVATRLGSNKEGRGRWLSSRGVRRSPWCGRGRTGATTALKGISGDGGSVEVRAVASGHASARGSACSKERRVAELLDTAARRGVDGGRGYGEGVAAMASAMAGERGRGAGEERGCLGGSGEREMPIHDVSRAREAARQRAGAWHPCGARRRAPACLPGRQAARWRGAGLGRQVGRVLGDR